MGQRPVVQTKVDTKLAAWRVKRGVTQGELAAATGIPLTTYRRLERGTYVNPPLRHLGNCALALGCPLEALIEDEHRQWLALSPQASRPPDPEVFWRS